MIMFGLYVPKAIYKRSEIGDTIDWVIGIIITNVWIVLGWLEARPPRYLAWFFHTDWKYQLQKVKDAGRFIAATRPPSLPLAFRHIPSSYPQTSRHFVVDFSSTPPRIVSPSPSPPLSISSSPSPPPPSPSYSPSPPPLTHSDPPSSRYIQSSIASRTKIHNLLTFSPLSYPPLLHDISQSPMLVEKRCSTQELSEPATEPPLQRLTLTCPLLPWQLTISPFAQTGLREMAGFVTVQDVLRGLHAQLRQRVRRPEYDDLDRHEAELVNEAYWRRCAGVEDEKAREVQRRNGVRRIDFLKGQHRFLGLSGTIKGGEVLELHVS
ncbi:hypothetical protein AX17_001983 [Amanita inopinata Kibby_2008]|nr:hypothetical protein AX17_001983 [Amanita inopinata Kibby_2008]